MNHSGNAGNKLVIERIFITTKIKKNKQILKQYSEETKNADDELTNFKTKMHFKILRKLSGHYHKIYGMDIYKNQLLSGGQTATLLVHDIDSKRFLHYIPLRSFGYINGCTFSTDGNWIAAGGNNGICAIFTNMRQRNRLKKDSHTEPDIEYCHEGYVSDVKSVNNNLLISSSGDATCIIYDVNKQKKIIEYTDFNGDVFKLDIYRDKSVFIASAMEGSYLFDYRMRSRNIFAVYESFYTNCVRFFGDGNAFAYGLENGLIKLFDIRSYQQMNEYIHPTIDHGPGTVNTIDFSKSGYYLFAGYDVAPFCVAWNTITAEMENILTHKRQITCIKVLPDGHAVITSSNDYMQRIWI